MRGLLRVRHITTILTLFILLFFTIIVIYPVTAQNEQLYIDTENEVEEGEEFLVYVLTINETGDRTYHTDVEIDFNKQPYKITGSEEYPSISIQAPLVDENTEFTITAEKEGYNFTTHEITVLNKIPKLDIYIEDLTIFEGELFVVSVTDIESREEVEGALVYIESTDVEDETDAMGRVEFAAPHNRETIRIIAEKDGYQDGEKLVEINSQPSIWIQLQDNPNTFIAIAAFLLISAIIYVTLKQRKVIDSRAKEISKKETMKKYGISENVTLSTSDANKPSEQSSLQEDVRTQPQREAKVEEIRISKPREEKTIISANDQKEEDKVNSRKKTIDPEDKWFEGTDDIRYEIDKITGEIDEEGKDKWFEGIDDIRAKIDEKVKKKDKRKEESNDEGE